MLKLIERAEALHNKIEARIDNIPEERKAMYRAAITKIFEMALQVGMSKLEQEINDL